MKISSALHTGEQKRTITKTKPTKQNQPKKQTKNPQKYNKKIKRTQKTHQPTKTKNKQKKLQKEENYRVCTLGEEKVI